MKTVDKEAELLSFREKAKTLPPETLDRDIAELLLECGFLEEQVKADIASYSTKDLESANQKVAFMKMKIEIAKIELARKTAKDFDNCQLT